MSSFQGADSHELQQLKEIFFLGRRVSGPSEGGQLVEAISTAWSVHFADVITNIYSTVWYVHQHL